MRSIWKGHIQFSLVTIPVKVYNAIDTAQAIHFNQLHKGCNGPIAYDKRCKKCNKVLSNEEIVKGYQYEPDQYVILEPEDLEKIRLKSTKVIEIQGFVDAAEVHPMLYEAPYFAGPDGVVAAKAYTLLCEALKQSGKVGIGRVVLRDREDIVTIAPHEQGIVMYKLRYPNEVRDIKEVPQLDETQKVDPEQLKLARHLVDTMAASFGDIETKDRYRDALKELITAKVEGKEIVTVAEEARPAVDIMTALKQSIEQAMAQRQPMVKATGKGKKAKAEQPEEQGGAAEVKASEVKSPKGGRRKLG